MTEYYGTDVTEFDVPQYWMMADSRFNTPRVVSIADVCTQLNNREADAGGIHTGVGGHKQHGQGIYPDRVLIICTVSVFCGGKACSMCKRIILQCGSVTET